MFDVQFLSCYISGAVDLPGYVYPDRAQTVQRDVETPGGPHHTSHGLRAGENA